MQAVVDRVLVDVSRPGAPDARPRRGRGDRLERRRATEPDRRGGLEVARGPELAAVLGARAGAQPDGVHPRVPHHPGVPRRRLPGDDADRQLPGIAHATTRSRSAGAALVEGRGGALRRRRRHRHRAVVRVRPAVAGVHRSLRRRVRGRVRDRGDLLLHRGDLHGDLHLRLEAPVGVGALLDRRPGRHRWARRRLLGRRRQLVDEPAGWIQDRLQRAGHRRRPARCDLQPGDRRTRSRT